MGWGWGRVEGWATLVDSKVASVTGEALASPGIGDIRSQEARRVGRKHATKVAPL